MCVVLLYTGSCRPLQRSAQMQYTYERLADDDRNLGCEFLINCSKMFV